jgi:type 1 glutamine amidotransferase
MSAVRAVHLTAGLYHPSEATAAFWQGLFDELGYEVSTHEDIDRGCAELASRPHDLLVVSALRWSMSHSDRYEPHRAQWAYDIPEAARQAITAHLLGGGALLAMHTASICFDTWPEWEEMLGGRWVWGQSGHPPYGPVQTRVVQPQHELMLGVGDFDSRDEVYGNLRLAASVQALSESRPEGGAWMPTAWCNQWRGARVFYDALGHDMDSFATPAHRRLLTNALDWLLGDRRSTGGTK